LFIDRASTHYVGLFGCIDDAEIYSIGVTNVDITGNYYVGGLVGFYSSYSTISNSYSTGSVSGDHYVGGLVGLNSGSSTINNSYSTSSVSGNFDVGGLVGLNSEYVSNSSSTGSVSGNTNVGGLVGRNNNSTISNSYSSGFVSGDDSVGGLVGVNEYSSTISKSYSIGFVSGDTNVGGLVGYIYNSTVSNSFWDTETSWQSSSNGGTGKTTAEMNNVTTFTDLSTAGLSSPWDFVGNPNDDTGTVDYWDIDGVTNDCYPFLSWQRDGPPPEAPAGGDGTSGNPYQIATLNNLYWISVYPDEWDKHYIQIADIDASSTATWNGGDGFLPIGDFTGSYNGQDHTIDALFIDRASMGHVGLFGFTNGAEIDGIGVTNADITGDGYVGGLVGWNNNILTHNVNITITNNVFFIVPPLIF